MYGKYLITETKAPEGYELLKEPIQVEINKENNGVIEKKVYNKKNINLPFVGGRGTIIYILVGNIFVFSALLIYKSLIINFKNHSKSYKLNGKLKGEVYENKEEF
ncbi:SpaA isopeptide-forming pilin-related protein [Clostridium sp.]|uniref:SpaA isopeptide-forming pilin-related protein n=1 Tax=Clostridium sp. TaxID=1506 RepID=UPI003967CE81